MHCKRRLWQFHDANTDANMMQTLNMKHVMKQFMKQFINKSMALYGTVPPF